MAPDSTEGWRGPSRGDFLMLPPMSTGAHSTASLLRSASSFAVTRRRVKVAERTMAHGVNSDFHGMLRVAGAHAPVTPLDSPELAHRIRPEAEAAEPVAPVSVIGMQSFSTPPAPAPRKAGATAAPVPAAPRGSSQKPLNRAIGRPKDRVAPRPVASSLHEPAAEHSTLSDTEVSAILSDVVSSSPTPIAEQRVRRRGASPSVISKTGEKGLAHEEGEPDSPAQKKGIAAAAEPDRSSDVAESAALSAEGSDSVEPGTPPLTGMSASLPAVTTNAMPAEPPRSRTTGLPVPPELAPAPVERKEPVAPAEIPLTTRKRTRTDLAEPLPTSVAREAAATSSVAVDAAPRTNASESDPVIARRVEPTSQTSTPAIAPSRVISSSTTNGGSAMAAPSAETPRRIAPAIAAPLARAAAVGVDAGSAESTEPVATPVTPDAAASVTSEHSASTAVSETTAPSDQTDAIDDSIIHDTAAASTRASASPAEAQTSRASVNEIASVQVPVSDADALQVDLTARTAPIAEGASDAHGPQESTRVDSSPAVSATPTARTPQTSTPAVPEVPVPASTGEGISGRIPGVSKAAAAAAAAMPTMPSPAPTSHESNAHSPEAGAATHVTRPEPTGTSRDTNAALNGEPGTATTSAPYRPFTPQRSSGGTASPSPDVSDTTPPAETSPASAGTAGAGVQRKASRTSPAPAETSEPTRASLHATDAVPESLVSSQVAAEAPVSIPVSRTTLPDAPPSVDVPLIARTPSESASSAAASADVPPTRVPAQGSTIPAGTTAPAHGSTIPAGTTAPAHGSTIPAGTTAPAHGSTIPAGTTAPAHGSTIPAGTTAPAHGSTIPAGTTAPAHGSSAAAASSAPASTMSGVQRRASDTGSMVESSSSGPDTAAESSSDHVAAHETPTRGSSSGTTGEPDRGVRIENPAPMPDIPLVARSSSDPGQVDAANSAMPAVTVPSARPSSQNVPDDVRAAVAAVAGEAPRSVAIKRGAHVDAHAATIKADAFTAQGTVHIPGTAPLTSDSSRRLLAHELTHVVQQQRHGSALPPENSAAGRALEAEALRAEGLIGMPRSGSGRTLPVTSPSLASRQSAPDGTTGSALTARGGSVAGLPPFLTGASAPTQAPPTTMNTSTAAPGITAPLGGSSPNPGVTAEAQGSHAAPGTPARANGSTRGGGITAPRGDSTVAPGTTAVARGSSPTSVPSVELEPRRPVVPPAESTAQGSTVVNYTSPRTPQSGAGAPPASVQRRAMGTPPPMPPADIMAMEEPVPSAPSPRAAREVAKSPAPPQIETWRDDRWLEKHATALYPLIRNMLRNELLRDRERRGKMMREY